MNDDNGKKLLIGGGLIALGAIILNQIYTSGFEAGMIAGGGDPGAITRYGGHGGFPGGFIFLLAIGGFIWWKMSNGGRRGPGGPGGFFGGRRGPGGFFDDRRQGGWPNHQQNQQPQQYGAPQQPQPQPQPPYNYPAPGAAPQPPVNYGGQSAPPPPPANYSPPTPPAPGYPQSEPGQPTAPAAASDPNKPVI